MNGNTSLKMNLSLIALLAVNFLFLVKYSARVTDYSVIVSLILSILYFGLYRFKVLYDINGKILQKMLIAGMVVFVAFSAIIFRMIPQDSVNVDRWSVITSFWDTCFAGRYAYSAESHHGNLPGPMPFYFILALPFYFTGELGYFSLTGFFVFYLTAHYSGMRFHTRLTGVLLVLFSGFYLWEIITRSNILINSSLILLSMIFYLKTTDFSKMRDVVITGVITGLLLSTRNVLVIPYIILFMYLLQMKLITFRQLLATGVVVALTFMATFIPFVTGHFQEFLNMNPFLIQSSFLMPSAYSVACIGLAFLVFFLKMEKSDVFFFSGVVLFFTISVYFLYRWHLHGFDNAFYGSKVDISYFILCIPFFLYYVLIRLEEQKKVMK
jgi:hypothetical protein